MNDIKDQIKLLKKVRVRRSKYEYREDARRQKIYILSFLKRHRFLILGTLLLFVTQGVVETLLIFVSKNKLSFNSYSYISKSFWPIFGVLVLVFVINSFFSIKREKTITVLFINDLRRRIFKNYLGKPLEMMSSEKQSDLVAKISYHLPLVSMGVSNSIFGMARWLIYLASALLVAFLAGLNVALIDVSFITLSIVISVISYFVVKQYVSQEVTFFSQIIKHIDLSFSEKYFSKGFNLEPAILKKFDRLVDFDSIFRIRRDLWMKMSFKIIFILLLFISILTHFFYGDVSLWVNLISPELKFLYFFLLIYLSRIVTESLRIGLYFFPAKLGLSLTNVQLERYLHRKDSIKINKEISFYSKKIKFSRTGKYYRGLKFDFQKSGRYLFYGPNLSGKTTLAKAFVGREIHTPKALKVRIDGHRINFLDYQRNFSDVYFFDPGFYSQKSLIELITGSGREDTDFARIEQAMKIVIDHKFLADIVADDNNLGVAADNIWSNHLAAFALHTLYCLVNKPTLIIIDNLWLDLNYPDIIKMLKIIDSELPDSIIIVFAQNSINNIDYIKRYEMDKDFNSKG